MASPTILSPCSSGRRSSDSNSPEFEFWMVGNPSFPQPNLLSADELFVDGVLLPLHLLHLHQSHHPPDDDPHPQPPNTGKTTPNSHPPLNSEPDTEPATGSEFFTGPLGSSANALMGSKRWKDLFKKSGRKNTHVNSNNDGVKEKEKKKESKGGVGASSAELNINIWPFSRSTSAGNGGNGPKMFSGPAVTRKVSSAPCSRSNSAGESKTRKWPNSPSRGGVHLGRSSPVWQVRRGGSAGRSSDRVAVWNVGNGFQKEGNENRRKKPASAGGDGSGGKARVLNLNLNVPMCIGYRQHLSCKSDQSNCRSAVSVAPGGGGGSEGQSGGGGSDEGGRGGNLHNLRNLFTKKVY